jgi:hypothetical protein
MPHRPTSLVLGPAGVLTADNLPPADTVRWMPRKKAELVAAVRGGLITLDEVCARYGLTAEEYFGWQDGLQQSGMTGLCVTSAKAGRRRKQGGPI